MKQLLLSLCMGSLICFGQGSFENYTTKDGLPSNQVYDIHQDKNGIIWFATDRGISSFNGSFFTNYSTHDGLLSDVVLDFYPQTDGTFWCSTEKNKLFIVDPLKLTFKAFKFNHLIPEANDGSMIRDLLIDNGNYFIRFMGMTGYLKITSSGKAEPYQQSKSMASLKKYYVVQLKRDFYYYSTNKTNGLNDLPLHGAFRDPIVNNGDYTARIKFDYLEILDKNKEVNRIQFLKNRQILQVGKIGSLFWVSGYNMGVKLLDSKGKVHQSYLSNLPCSNFFKDRDDGIWISTLSNGVYYYPSTNINLFEHFQNECITSLSISGQNLAFGTYAGKVVGYSFLNNSYKEETSSSNGIVRFYNGKLFTNALFQGGNMFHHYVRRFSENQKSPLLCVGPISIFENFTNEHKFRCEDKMYDADFINSNFLISQGTCVKIINRQHQVVDSVDLKTTTYDLDYVNGKIYCGTSTRGLLILDSKLKTIYCVNVNSGLTSNYINDVKIALGSVWLATRNGISRVQNIGTKKQRVSTITVSNGLSDQEVNNFDFMGDTILVGTRRGINYFSSKKWDEIVESKASIFFSIKKISQHGAAITKTVGLSHDQNDLTFEIELATFKLNKEILFRYKLNGVDKKWTTTRSRIIHFKSLPPGEYELLIQANVNDHWHEKVIRQKIQILPAWYTTWWFILSLILSVGVIIWMFFKYRILNYNREIIREILRQTLKRIKRNENVFVVRSNGRDIKLVSADVLYIESSRNYITIYLTGKKVVIRGKISEFLGLVPDPLEYIQIKRSTIVRIDQVKSRGKDSITIADQEIKVGGTYLEEFKKLLF